MPGIIIKGSGAPAQDGNISFEALQEFGKTVNFARGTVQKFVRSYILRRFFFVAIVNVLIVKKTKLLKRRIEKATGGLVQHRIGNSAEESLV